MEGAGAWSRILRGARVQRPTARSQHPTEQTPPRWIAQGGRSPCAALFAVTSWAGALRQWPQRRRELHNPPAFPVDQDRRILSRMGRDDRPEGVRPVGTEAA